MNDLLQTTSRVKQILVEEPNTRSNDVLLILSYFRRCGIDIKASFEQLALSGQLTCMESITRARRKVQECHPELKNISIAERRKLRREQFKGYALEVKGAIPDECNNFS